MRAEDRKTLSNQESRLSRKHADGMIISDAHIRCVKQRRCQGLQVFPDPDIPPVRVTDDMIDEIRGHQPEFREEKEERYAKEYDLPEYDIEQLTSSKKYLRRQRRYAESQNLSQTGL